MSHRWDKQLPRFGLVIHSKKTLDSDNLLVRAPQKTTVWEFRAVSVMRMFAAFKGLILCAQTAWRRRAAMEAVCHAINFATVASTALIVWTSRDAAVRFLLLFSFITTKFELT